MAPLPAILLQQRAGIEKGKRDGSKRQILSLQVFSSLAYYALSGVDS